MSGEFDFNLQQLLAFQLPCQTYSGDCDCYPRLSLW